MFEAALVLLLATGGLMIFTRRWQQPPTNLPIKTGFTLVTVIAPAGLYGITKPGETGTMTAFADLQLVRGGLLLHDSYDWQERYFEFSAIQWVSAVRTSEAGIAEITLHLEIGRLWRLVRLQMPDSEMALLLKVLRRTTAPSRFQSVNNPPLLPIPARTVEETLQGETTIGAEVQLYLLPRWLLVLDGDVVQAKIALSTLRRVLSVERISGKLDALLRRGTPEGIIRLYSLNETAVFALSEHRKLAEEISYLASCPVEYISSEEKTGKV